MTQDLGRTLNSNLDALDHVKTQVLDLGIQFGPRLLVAVLVLVVGAFVGRWLAKLTEGFLKRFALEPPVRTLLLRVLRVLVFVLFLILALQNLGIQLLPLIAGLGVAGAGLALATQGVLSNLVAGLTIIFTKPYVVGDYIEVAGVQGQVNQISLFNTILLHIDHSHVVVPNRKIVGEILHNFGQIRQAEVLVGVGYEVELSHAVEAFAAVVRSNGRVLKEPAPLVQVVSLAESSVQIAVRPWVAVADIQIVIDELSRALVDDCHQRGISIPFPQREVRLLAEGREGDGQ
ncbi:MAG TPA: mechanosensitive ion channel domain-containing protein [Steroidobacteraceae bacterium]|jgi:small conductance mechanosensitive channel|nr:mechanosensitive ion channel domain-containing protein [Steroidobacteraceae bacterium]